MFVKSSYSCNIFHSKRRNFILFFIIDEQSVLLESDYLSTPRKTWSTSGQVMGFTLDCYAFYIYLTVFVLKIL